jgi:hypothetical protein
MKPIRALLMASAVAAAAFAATSATAQPNVGVSVNINQPGVYGRIDIGNMPPPPVVYAQPRYYGPPPVQVVQPAYLYVPPGHQKNWRKHCHRYNACGQPVYFVKESWVRERYEHEHGRDDDRGHGKKDKHDKHDKHGKH